MDTRQDAESSFLRTLVNTIPDLVWLTGHDGVFLTCNAAFERLCGAKECDILGKSELDFAATTQAGFFRENDQAAMASGNSCRHEAWLTFADGYCGLFEAIQTPMRDSVGKLIGVLGVARDITASRQAQEARERDFRTLAEHLPDNIARWDVTGRYLYINPTHERTLGVSARSIIGTEIQEAGKSAIEQVIASGEAAIFAHQTVLVDGVSQIHDVSMVPEYDDEGRIVSVLGLGRNMTEVYRLQDELSAKERELRALAESTPGMMGAFYLRPDGSKCMPYVSPKIKELFGLQPQDVLNDASALLALNHPEDAQRVMDTIVASGQNMSTWHEEFRILHPTRGERWMESNTNPQPHPQGGIVWYGYIHDITERKLIEQSLRLKEFVLDQAHEAVYLMNRTNLRFTYVNAAAYNDLGYSREELLDLTLNEICPEFTPDQGRAIWEKVLANGSYTFETRHRRRDGSFFPVEIQGSMFEYEGQVLNLSLVRDITERRRAEAELQSREQKFRSLAESSPDSVIRYDLDHRILYLNDLLVRDLELASGDEVIGKRPIEVWPDGRFAVIDEAAKRVIASGTAETVELVRTRDHGVPRVGQIVVVPERDATGRVIGTLAFGRDITAIREGERRLAHFLDNLPGLAFTFRVTPEGRGCFPFMSSAIKEYYGLEPADVMDDMAQLHALAHPDDQSRIEEAIARSVQTQTEMRIDFRACRPGHPERWLNVISMPNRQPDGTSLWYGIMLDVTERKQAEHAVLKLNADLSATISAIPDLLFEVDREGNQLRVHARNPALSSQWNPDFAGQSVNELLTSDAIGIVVEALGEADETGHSYGKVIGVHLAGRACWFELSVARKLNFPDAEVTFIVLARNVTERFDAEQSIKEHVRFLEGMDLVNKAIQGADDIQTMMSHVLDVVLSIFGCDRAFLLHPCDPDAARWTIPMERHRPPYPGVLSMGIDLPHDPAIADKMRLLLRTDGPVKLGGDAEHATPLVLADQFQVQSLMSIAIYPQTGSPWEFGIHQCSGARSWKPWEERLFQAIGRRLGDSLSALLAYQNLLGSEEKLRQSNNQLLELTMRREADREDERKCIAREIHDELGQNLTALRMSISQLRFQFGAANPELASHIEHMHKLAASALQTVRDVTKSLRPPVLDAGVGAALLWLVSEFQQSTQGVFCLNLPSDNLLVDDEHALAIFRIVQESLTNVVRHASATRVDITVEEAAGFLHIVIADNGQGFDADKIKMGGFGLIGMSERARMMGGSFEVQAKPGSGTCLTVIIPAQKLKETL